MAEVLVEFPEVVIGEDGTAVRRSRLRRGGAVRAMAGMAGVRRDSTAAPRCGRPRDDPAEPGRYRVLGDRFERRCISRARSERALHPVTRKPRAPARPHRLSTAPRPDHVLDEPAVDSILNPFSVYRKGETLLRRQLTAFSVWHLVNIVLAHGLSDLPAATLNGMARPI